MLKKLCASLLTASFLATPLLAYSGDYLVVVPVPGRVAATPLPDPIVVSLESAALPDAKVGTAYSHNLRDYLTVKGDDAFDQANVTWSVLSENLPTGLTLNSATGVLGGTPRMAVPSAEVEVVASYKDASGQAVYTIKIGDLTFDATQIVTTNSTSTSDATSCVLRRDTTVYCWGENGYGQLGIGTTATSRTPVKVPGLTGVTKLAAASKNVCAVLSSGSVQCWGYGIWGANGGGSSSNRYSPTAVSNLTTAVDISGGNGHFCALLSNQTVRCWGMNDRGQLGDNSTEHRYVPTPVLQVASGTAHLSGVTAISAGLDHTCATLENGTGACWGLNNYSKLGDGSSTMRIRPVAVQNLTGIRKLMAGGGQTCAIMTDATLRCWGRNDFGQLGIGNSSDRNTPQLVPLSGVVDVKGNDLFTCATTTAGAAYCWGNNSNGQLGDGTWTNKLSPVQVIASGAVQISTSFSHACAMLTDGGVMCWGNATAVGPTGSYKPIAVKPAS